MGFSWSLFGVCSVNGVLYRSVTEALPKKYRTKPPKKHFKPDISGHLGTNTDNCRQMWTLLTGWCFVGVPS